MIDPKYYGLVELVLVAGLALGFGVWQLRSVNKALAESRRDAEAEDGKDPG